MTEGTAVDGIGRAFGPRWRVGITLAFFASVPLVLFALALWFGSEYQRLGSGEDDTRRAYARQLLISELFSSIKDAETGQRGYVLTGDDAFLGPYRTGQEAVRQSFAQLRSGSIDPAERRQLDRLQVLVDAKIAEMQRVIDMRDSAGLDAAAAIVRAGRGKRLMDDIRTEAANARATQAAALARTLDRQNERTRLTQQIGWIVVGVTTLFYMLFTLFWARLHRERLRLERQSFEAATRRKAIFEGTLDAIVLINPSGSVETLNPAASRLFGYPANDMVRRDISLVVDLAPGEGPFLERIGLGSNGLAEPFRHHVLARRADGGTVSVEAALGVMSLPDGQHIVAAFRDISEREQAERLKDQFLSTVSHELRTPLTSIIGSLALLRGGLNGDLSPGPQRLVTIAENNANRLIRLVNDLLDIEKFESGSMSLDFLPIDLRDSAGKAIEAMRGLAQKQGVELVLELGSAPVVVRGDGDRLVQVMSNLLGNAVRFTPPGGRVSLVVSRRAGHAEASVIDQGPGIDEELKGRLFTRFGQSMQAPTGTDRGTGLGLAISREIVRGHGGNIGYEPAPGGGSIFRFDLPLWNAVTNQPDQIGAPRVLICADQNHARMIVNALENSAIRADIVDGDSSLIAALGQGRYLAAVLDCHCLGGDGTHLLQEIRADPALRRLPIIAIAGNERQDPSDFASLDLIDWIPRPIDPARLNEALGSVMERHAGTMPLVLHLDDDTDTLEITSAALEGRARMARATDLAAARAFMASHSPDLVIVDLALPDGSGAEFVADLAAHGAHATPVIIYSAQDDGGEFASEVVAVLTKSKRSLSTLVETVTDILDQQAKEETDDAR